MSKLKIDLHVHTNASPDGITTPAMAVRAALKRKLNGIAVTDHNTNIAINAVRAAAPKNFIIIPGVEYSTDFGHVLTFFCGELCTAKRDEQGRIFLHDLAPFIRERGGVLILAHPFQHAISIPDEIFTWVHGLESVNSRALLWDKTGRSQAEEAAMKHGLFTTGGSDSHLPWEIGNGYTAFPGDVDLREALLCGACKPYGEAAKKWQWAASRIWKRLR